MSHHSGLSEEQLEDLLQQVRNLWLRCNELHQHTARQYAEVERMRTSLEQREARLQQEESRREYIRRGYHTDDPKEIPHSPDSAISPIAIQSHDVRSPQPLRIRPLPEYMRNARVQRTPDQDRGCDPDLSNTDHHPMDDVFLLSEGQTLGEMAMQQRIEQIPSGIRLTLSRRPRQDQLRCPATPPGQIFPPADDNDEHSDTANFLCNAGERYAPERVRAEFRLKRDFMNSPAFIVYTAEYDNIIVPLCGFDWTGNPNAHRQDDPWSEHSDSWYNCISVNMAHGLNILGKDRIDCIVWLEIEIAVRQQRISEDLAELLWVRWVEQHPPSDLARVYQINEYQDRIAGEDEVQRVAFVADM